MNYEVEMKFPVADRDTLQKRLAGYGLVWHEPIVQVDRYFNHPSRDFASTDEALRIRSVGERNWMTYKGPKIDAVTKTRRELEFPLVEGATACEPLVEVLMALGFRATAEVHKQRQSTHLTFQHREFEVLLDEVQGVGQFVEIETIATEEVLTQARESLLALAAELGLGTSERRSYLEMVLEKQVVG
ncbi:MAG: class IV adenylate cyclase [Planctomycetaceae bacterium]|nr:class IV adenylate cyclase [Planctomycetaceae bacterium]